MEKLPILKVINTVALVAIAMLLFLSYIRFSEIVVVAHRIGDNTKYLASIFSKTPRQVECLYLELTPEGRIQRKTEEMRPPNSMQKKEEFPAFMPREN